MALMGLIAGAPDEASVGPRSKRSCTDRRHHPIHRRGDSREGRRRGGGPHCLRRDRILRDVLDGLEAGPEDNGAAEDAARANVTELCGRYPIYNLASGDPAHDRKTQLPVRAG